MKLSTEYLDTTGLKEMLRARACSVVVSKAAIFALLQ